MATTRQRVSLATYLAARKQLLWDASCYRQWAKSEPDNAEHWLGHLRNKQRQMAELRKAERLPMLAQGAGQWL